MKKTFLFLLTFLVIGASTLQAQDVKAIKKILKSSSKALKKYKTDPTNKANLDNALIKLDEALKMEGAESLPNVWMAKGNIFQAQAEQDIIARSELMKNDVLAKTNTADSYKIASPEASVMAFESYLKALELTEKKSSKSKIVKELEKNATFLNDIAGLLYQNNKDYLNSYKTFDALVKSTEIVKSNGGKPLLDKPEIIEEVTFYSAYTASLAEKKDEAIAIYEKLHASGSKRIDVYDALFKAYIDTDEAKALKYLEEGRAIDPENINLLFSEINLYLKNGDYATLEGKLQEAMEKEPENASLRTVMGNVYNDFFKKETDAAKRDEYFTKSESFYKKALDIDDENFEALYNLGELNYNLAASIVSKYNNLPVTASQRDVDALKAEYLSAFDKALPYFLKANDLNDSDYNTVLALKEIYAKKEDYAKSNEFKARLETLK